MTKTYELHIGRNLRTAWENFLRAPEIFVFLTLGIMATFYLSARLPFGSLLSFLASAFSAPAFFLLAEQGRREGRVSFAELKKLGQLAPQLLALFIAKTVIITLGMILFLIPGFYAILAYTFADLFVCLEGKNFWDAMETSRRLVNRNIFGIFGLGIVCVLILLTGALFVGVGLLAAVPLSALFLHATYHDIRSQGTHG